jgi:hypothetical protein
MTISDLLELEAYFSVYLCIIAVSPIENTRGKLEVVLEGDFLGVAPQSWLLDGIVVECESERRHAEWFVESEMR